jgi:hypothetical protein
LDSGVPKTKRKAQMSESKVMSLLIHLSDIREIIQYEFIPPLQFIKHSTFKFPNVYGRAFIKKDQIFGWASEHSIMIMCL